MKGVKPSALGGVGLGLLYFVLEAADVDIPTPVLVVLGVAALTLIMYGVVGWLIGNDLEHSGRMQSSVRTGRASATGDIVGRDRITNVGISPEKPTADQIHMTVTAPEPLVHSYVVTKRHGRVETTTIPHLTIDQHSDYAPQLKFRLLIKGLTLDGKLMNEVTSAVPGELSYYFPSNPKDIPGGIGQTTRHLGFAHYDVSLRNVREATLQVADMRGDAGLWWELPVPGSVEIRR